MAVKNGFSLTDKFDRGRAPAVVKQTILENQTQRSFIFLTSVLVLTLQVVDHNLVHADVQRRFL